MLRGMAQMDLKQRLKANRGLSVTMSFLGLVGWGGFAYSAGSSSSPHVTSARSWPNRRGPGSAAG